MSHPTFTQPETKYVVNELLRLVNALPKNKNKMDSTQLLVQHGRKIMEEKILGHSVDDVAYENEKFHEFLYLISSTPQMDRSCESYVGLTGSAASRIYQHVMEIRSFVLFGIPPAKGSDDEIAKAMINNALYYRHVAVPGVTRLAMRAIEDVTMISLIAVYGNGSIVNKCKGENRTNFKEFGLGNDLNVYAVGAYVLAHLLEVKPLFIKPLEFSESVNTIEHQLQCPVDGCGEERSNAYQFKSHYENDHPTLDFSTLMKMTFGSCRFGCGKTFKHSYVLATHESECEKNPECKLISCKFKYLGCNAKFKTNAIAQKHDCPFNPASTKYTHPCPHAHLGCNRRFTQKKSAIAHGKTDCPQIPDDEKELFECKFKCGSTFTRKAAKARHEISCDDNPDQYKFPCGTCGKRFTTKNGLLTHKRHQHKPKKNA